MLTKLKANDSFFKKKKKKKRRKHETLLISEFGASCVHGLDRSLGCRECMKTILLMAIIC